mgnify:CR=1 FL=1
MLVQVTKSGGGRTLVDGTAYEIGFAEPVTVTISGDAVASKELATVAYKGVTYRNTTITAEKGEELILTTVPYNWNSTNGQILINGTIVLNQTGSYTYTLSKDVNIQVGYYSAMASGKLVYAGRITVTEQ